MGRHDSPPDRGVDDAVWRSALTASGWPRPGCRRATGDRSVDAAPHGGPGRLRLGRFLERADAVPVINDAHAALLGEVWQGAARGKTDAVLLTLGTGVGRRHSRRRPFAAGAIGRAGHLGHLSLDPHGPISILRTPGAIEELIGECSLGARSGGRFRPRARCWRPPMRATRGSRGVGASVRALACAIASYINVLDPEVVILGGGITEAGDRLWRPLAHEMDQVEWRPGGHRVPIVRAKLGGWAGAYGAAAPTLKPRPATKTTRSNLYSRMLARSVICASVMPRVDPVKIPATARRSGARVPGASGCGRDHRTRTRAPGPHRGRRPSSPCSRVCRPALPPDGGPGAGPLSATAAR